MKKLGIVFSVLAIMAFFGCASSGGGAAAAAASGGDAAEPYSVDLSTVSVSNWTRSTKAFTAPVKGVRNVDPFPGQWDGVIVHFNDLPDVTGFSRITIKVKKYKADGTEWPAYEGGAMVVMFYDVNGDLEGPEGGPGRNTPLKEFNLGGPQGQVSTDRGSRIILSQNPGGLLIQCSVATVKFIEISEVTFHN